MMIQIVDDDEEDRDLFCEAMRSANEAIEFICARDGEEALSQLEQGIRPNIIFLDLNMPRMNGKDCLTRLKSNDRFKNIPVIILSTASNDTEIAYCLALGAREFIVKPTSFEKLVRTVRVFVTSNGY